MLNISGSRGTTFIRCCLAIATSLGTSDIMGRRSTYPITGITGKVYFQWMWIYTSQRFLLAASGSFSRVVCYGHSTSCPLSGCNGTCYSSLQGFCVIQLFLCVVLKIPSNQGCVNGVFSQGMCVRM